VIAAALHAIPLLVKSSRAALENVDEAYERAARSLGASEWRLFWRVSFPLARRPIAAATALAFARSLGDFGTTLMIAGDIPGRTQTAAIAIYDAAESGNTLVARTLVIVISILTAAIVYFATGWKRAERHEHGYPGRRPADCAAASRNNSPQASNRLPSRSMWKSKHTRA